MSKCTLRSIFTVLIYAGVVIFLFPYFIGRLTNVGFNATLPAHAYASTNVYFGSGFHNGAPDPATPSPSAASTSTTPASSTPNSATASTSNPIA
jgi:hypothetical protein